MNPAQHLLCLMLRVYRGVVSPALVVIFGPMGWGCRYTPTCSQYAFEAVRTQGALRGSWLAARRLLRCHPWGGWGHDPVPNSERASHQAISFYPSQRSCTGLDPSSEATCSHHPIHSVTSH